MSGPNLVWDVQVYSMILFPMLKVSHMQVKNESVHASIMSSEISCDKMYEMIVCSVVPNSFMRMSYVSHMHVTGK